MHTGPAGCWTVFLDYSIDSFKHVLQFLSKLSDMTVIKLQYLPHHNLHFPNWTQLLVQSAENQICNCNDFRYFMIAGLSEENPLFVCSVTISHLNDCEVLEQTWSFRSGQSCWL